ncbi:UNVERIFIED_CONTAM: sialic acid synthase SpsE [Brevibacillus sp. OAP136]
MNWHSEWEHQVRIGARRVGNGSPCYIIAEAGANHNRDLAMAKALIDVAADAGCDAVKFQTYSAQTLYSKYTPTFSYLGDQNVYELIKSCELPREWQFELMTYANERKLDFLSTPFDFSAVDDLVAIGVPAIKIASFELVDLELLRYAAATGKPLILSTGMASLGEVEEALEVIRSEGNRQLVLLHCNSLYPTPAKAVNLRTMHTLQNAFFCPVGFSDHTVGSVIATAAAALGAAVIEKHFTLSRKLPGPDHGAFALEPEELRQMVADIRAVEAAMGTGSKKRDAAEEEMALKGRRSIIAATDIIQGMVITKDMLNVKRPGTGIPPKFLDLVVGRVAQQDIREDEPIGWHMI